MNYFVDIGIGLFDEIYKFRSDKIPLCGVESGEVVQSPRMWKKQMKK